MLDVGISVTKARRRLRWGNLRNPSLPPLPNFGAAIALSSSFRDQPTTLFVTRRLTGGVSFWGLLRPPGGTIFLSFDNVPLQPEQRVVDLLTRADGGTLPAELH